MQFGAPRLFQTIISQPNFNMAPRQSIYMMEEAFERLAMCVVGVFKIIITCAHYYGKRKKTTHTHTFGLGLDYIVLIRSVRGEIRIDNR